MNKYEVFFTDLNALQQKLEGATNQGVNEADIEALEVAIDFKFGLGYRTYLKYQGARKLQNIKLAYEYYNKYDDLNLDTAKRQVLDIPDEEPNFSTEIQLDKLCLTDYVGENAVFEVIDQQENPAVYLWWSEPHLEKEYHHFTHAILWQWYCSMAQVYREKKYGSGIVNLEHYTAQYISEIKKMDWLDLGPMIYLGLDYDFFDKLYVIETTENRLISLEEFGRAYKRHRQENDSTNT